MDEMKHCCHIDYLDFNYWIRTLENASCTSSSSKQAVRGISKKKFIWTGQHILGIRKYRICVHDCFLMKKVGHILGIMEFLICIHECFIVKKAVGEITLVSDFWILQVIGNLLFSLIGNSPSWFLHLTVRTLEAAECTISRGLAVSQIQPHTILSPSLDGLLHTAGRSILCALQRGDASRWTTSWHKYAWCSWWLR